MTSRHALLLSAALFAPSSLILACGSSIEVSGDGGGTTTGTTTTGTGNAGTGGTSTGSTTGTGGFTGGSGGTNTGGTNTGGTTGTGGSVACAGIATEVECLGAHPSCVPVYDDKCCPSCDPVGGCADCINIRFHHCAPLAEACGPNETSCGLTPDWACAGGKADCAMVNPGGSIEPCHTVAGCTAAYCAVNADCTTDPICTAVTKGSCTTLCDGLPPPCAPGLIAESNGSCYTGRCVDPGICGGAL